MKDEANSITVGPNLGLIPVMAMRATFLRLDVNGVAHPSRPRQWMHDRKLSGQAIFG